MKEIVYTIKVKQDDGTEKEIQKAAKSTKEYGEAIQQLQEKLDDTDLGSDQYKKVSKDLKTAEKSFQKAKIKAQSFSDTMKEAPGILGQASKGVEGLGVGFKALLANPVALVFTAIVGALSAMVKAFKSTKEGAEFFEQATAGVSAVMDVFRDILVTVGKRLVSVFKDPKQALIDFKDLLKQNIINRFEGLLELIPALGKAIGELFKGNFKESGKIAADAVAKVTLGVENITDKAVEAGQAVKKVFDEAVNEGKRAAELTGVLQSLDDKQRSLNERRAEQNKLIAESKRKINDETLSYDERIAALEEVSAAEQQLLDDELALERQRLASMEAMASLSDSSKEDLDALSAQRIKLSNLEEQSFNKSKEIFDQTKALKDRQKAEDQAKADEDERLSQEALQRQKDNLDAEIELQMLKDEKDLELLKEKLTARLELELENEELSNEQKALLREQLNQQLKTLDDEATAAKEENTQREIALEQQKAQAIADGLGMLSNVLGKETQAGKAAASAQALINTYLGASQVIADEKLPTLAKFVAVAAIIGSGLKQVASINKVDTALPGFSEGGLVEGPGTGTSDSITARLSKGESVINARSTAMFAPQLSMMNMMGGGTAIPFGGNASAFATPVIKSYVVSSEIQSQAQFDRNVKQRSKI